jgi:hypothetical protein
MPAIRYDFIGSGADSIESMFERIDARALRSERTVGGAFRGIQQASRRAAANDNVRGGDVAQRTAAVEQRAIEQTAKARRKAHDAAYRDAERLASKIEREENRAATAAERAAQKRAQAEKRASDRISAESRRTLGSIGSGVATSVIGGGAALLGATVGAAARDEMRLQEASQGIAINARQAGQQGLDAGTLRREFEATAIASGGTVKASEVADAVQRFISLTGDVDTARKGQSVFATVAGATGANVGDVAEAAASISQQFDIKGLEDMKDVLAALTFQGKAGAFELKDAAAQFQRLAASGGAFGLAKNVQGVKTIGGLTQIARTGTGSAEQAATAVENLFTNLKTKAPQLQRQGVNVYKDGKVRDVREIIVESIAKVGGNNIARKQAGLSSIFGEQGIRAINPLVSQYNDVYRQTQGTEAQKAAAGMAALTAALDKAINAPGDWTEVQKDAAAAQQMSSAKVGAAWEEVKAKVGDAVLPALVRMAEAITGSSGALDPFIEAVGLTADGLAALIEFLKRFGLIDEKDRTHAEKAAEAQKKIAAFDKESGIGPLTPEKAAQRQAFLNTYARETSLAWAPAEQTTNGMAPQEFYQRYIGMNRDKYGTSERDRQRADIEAREMTESLVRDPQSFLSSNDKYMRGSGETQEQRDLRRDFQGQVAAGKAGTGPAVEMGELSNKLVALTGAAAAAQRALAQIDADRRPHILQGG